MYEPSFLAFACQHEASLRVLLHPASPAPSAPQPSLMDAASPSDMLRALEASRFVATLPADDDPDSLPDGTPACALVALGRLQARAWLDAAELWRAASALSASVRDDPSPWLAVQALVRQAVADELRLHEIEGIRGDLSDPPSLAGKKTTGAAAKRGSLHERLLATLAEHYNSQQSGEESENKPKKKKATGATFASVAVPALMAPYLEQARLAARCVEARARVTRWTTGGDVPFLAALPDIEIAVGQDVLAQARADLDSNVDDLLRGAAAIGSFAAWSRLVERTFAETYAPAMRDVRERGKDESLAQRRRQRQKAKQPAAAAAED
ncbi:MAG TPA: hypothetical protein VIY73_13790, partial [Polyangiaceae bacterium]